MKRIISLKYVLLLFLVLSSLCLYADCKGYDPATHPEHYCACTEAARLSGLSGLSDLNFSDSLWFKTSSSTFTKEGITAYLFSESDVQVDIYGGCKATTKMYSFTVNKNQTRDLDRDAIAEKLANFGTGVDNVIVYALFYPITEGANCRLMCYPYNSGPHSSIDQPLPVLLGMTYVSSHAEDVYEWELTNANDSLIFYTFWSDSQNNACSLLVTRGSATGPVVAEHEFYDEESAYFYYDQQLIHDAKAAGESLFLHFYHADDAPGRILTNAVETTIHTSDVVTCAGKSWEYDGVQYTQPTLITYDTIWNTPASMDVFRYNLIFTQPAIQHDTLALKTTDLPYSYRGHTLTTFQDLDLLVTQPGQCDERIQLHVYHAIDTIRQTLDSTVCYGAIFTHNGKNYTNNVSFTDTACLDADTYRITTLNVYFDTEPTIIHDTLLLKTTNLPNRYRLPNGNSEYIRQFGDFIFDYENPPCQERLMLHVAHDVDTLYQTIDTILCANTSFLYNDTLLISSDTTFVDSLWLTNDLIYIGNVRVRVAVDHTQYDTLYLKTTDFPYLYRKQQYLQLESLGQEIDVYLQHNNACDEHYRLCILHRVDTLHCALDTTVCQGLMYEYSPTMHFVSDTTFIDAILLNPDTFQLTSVSVHFAQPELHYDTLALTTTELPYLYREQASLTSFGDHDIVLHAPQQCDQRYLVHLQHRVDTVHASLDTLLCQGRVFAYNQQLSIYSDTTFVDSLLINVDTLQILSVKVSFDSPDIQQDTLRLKNADLPYLYREQYTIQPGGIGQVHDVLLTYPDSCNERYALHVIHDYETRYVVMDTTLCQGKSYNHRGEIYTETIALLDEDWVDADTYQITLTNLVFAEPDPQYDTIGIRSTQLPFLYRNQATLTTYGNYDLTLHTPDSCDERYLLHLYHQIDTLRFERDSVAYGYSFVYQGKTYLENSAFETHIQHNADTVIINILHVYLDNSARPVVDTVCLKTTDFPYFYPLPDYEGLTVKTFGDYEKEYINFDTWIDEHLYLHICHDIDTITQELDTTLCQGRVYWHEGVEYTEPSRLEYAHWLNPDTWQITTLNLAFYEPEIEHDTLTLSTAQLISGYYYQAADTTIYTAGEHLLQVLEYDQCTRYISLLVKCDVATSLSDLPSSTSPRLVIRNGQVYIIIDDEYYTLLGERL